MSRRQDKANRRRAAVLELDQRNAFEHDRFPEFAAAISSCSCGRVAWIMQGADSDEMAEFDNESADHAAGCWSTYDDFVDSEL